MPTSTDSLLSLAASTNLFNSKPSQKWGRSFAGRCASTTSIVLAALGALTLSPTAVAEVAERQLGDTHAALPGLNRVGVATVSPRTAAGAMDMGYGFTEAQPGESAGHHRAMGSVAASFVAFPWLQPAVFMTGRYDRHPDDAYGTDDGIVADATLLARLVVPNRSLLLLGAQLGATLPGADDVSNSFRAITPQAELLLGLKASTKFWLASSVGYRAGRGDRTIEDPERLRVGDRLALSVSEFDAVTLGFGPGYVSGPLDLFAEATWDVLLGGPAALESPLRAAMGLRYALSQSLKLQTLAEVGLSQRSTVAPDAPLSPVEPRFSVLSGVRFMFPGSAPPAPDPQQTLAPLPPAKPPEKPKPPPPAKAELSVRVLDADGGLLPGAGVTVRTATGERLLDSVADGYKSEIALPETEKETTVTVHVKADGFVEQEHAVKVARGREATLEVRMQPVSLPAQLRGLVRSFAGKGVIATVRVEPLGVQASSDAQGFFELDVAPGDYEVTIMAEGYVEQRREVHVEEGGVTILNADLRKAR